MPPALFSLAAGLIRQIRDITWPSDRMPPGDPYGSQGQPPQQQAQQHQFQHQAHQLPAHRVQQLNHQHLPPLQPSPHSQQAHAHAHAHPQHPQHGHHGHHAQINNYGQHGHNAHHAPPPLLPHPHQHAGHYPNGNQHYPYHQQQQQHVQYVNPGYGQQHAQFYPSSAPQQPLQQQQPQQHQYPNHTAFHQPVPAPAPAPAPVRAPAPAPQLAPAPQPMPAPAPAPMPSNIAAPVQFVDPSFLQNTPAPRLSTNVFPSLQPRPASSMSPQLPRAVPLQSPALASQPVPVKASPKLEERRPPSQPMAVKASPKLEERRPPSRGTPKLLARDPRRPSSSAGVAKSPATSQAPSYVETLPLLLHVAEDCFEKANAAAQQAARTMTASEVAEHHKLVATGLGCLDVALKSNKLWPRLEARLCLRYTSILIEETTNITEAETTLTRGISVCEKVCQPACPFEVFSADIKPSTVSWTSNTAHSSSS